MIHIRRSGGHTFSYCSYDTYGKGYFIEKDITDDAINTTNACPVCLQKLICLFKIKLRETKK